MVFGMVALVETLGELRRPAWALVGAVLLTSAAAVAAWHWRLDPIVACQFGCGALFVAAGSVPGRVRFGLLLGVQTDGTAVSSAGWRHTQLVAGRLLMLIGAIQFGLALVRAWVLW